MNLPSRKEYSQRLLALVALLRQRPMTAKAIAEALHCSKPVVYRRLGALRRNGFDIYVIEVKESTTGPSAKAYGIH